MARRSPLPEPMMMRKTLFWLYHNGLEWLIGLLLLIIVILSCTQVFFRYVLSSPLSWIEEFAQLLLVWSVMLGAAVGVKRRMHLSIDFLFEKLTGWPRKLGVLVINLLILFVALGMIRYGFEFYTRTAGDYSTSLGFARNLFYLPIPVSGILTLFFIIPAIRDEFVGAHRQPRTTSPD